MAATAKILPFKTPNPTGHPAPSDVCRQTVKAARNKRIELTVQDILNIKATGAEKDFLWDSVVRGFGAYKTDTGICSYCVKKGNFRRTLGQLDDAKWPASPAANIKAARAEAFDLIRRFEAGEKLSRRIVTAITSQPAAGDILTVKLAFEIYIANRRSKKRQKLRPGTRDTYGKGFAYLPVAWHSRELWTITKDEVRALAEELWKRGRKKKGAAVRHGLGVFTYVWNYHAKRSTAIKNGVVTTDGKEHSMCPTVTLEADNLWPATPVKDAVVPEDLTAAWWRALESMLVKTNSWGDAWWTLTWVVFFKALVLMGTRRSEMLYSLWEHYDEAKGIWHFPGQVAQYDTDKGEWTREHGKYVGNKMGRDHKVFVGPYLAKLLKKYRAWQRQQYKGDRAEGNRYVFGNMLDDIRPDDPSNAVAQFRKVHPELNSFTWSAHVLRHTFESVAGSKELNEVIPWKAMQMLLNHEVESKSVTARYIHVSDKDMRHYAKLIETAILARAGVKS